MATNRYHDPWTDMSGQVALITGAGGGIGGAVAKGFLARGATVVLTDSRRDFLDAKVEALQVSRRDAVATFVCDVRDEGEVACTVEAVMGRFGQINVLVNSAGVALLEDAEHLNVADWDQTMDVNLKGTFLVSTHVGRHMLTAGSGSIVSLASQAATVALPGHAAYCASKAAVLGLTRVLAYEWGPRGVRVNAVSPTVVNTDMGLGAWAGEAGEALRAAIPLRRFANPEEIASAVTFLATSASSMVTGTNLVVDGGFTIC